MIQPLPFFILIPPVLPMNTNVF
ncbi:uncharacterized protein METZ01_LOCUS272029, partial [marine metagenome]